MAGYLLRRSLWAGLLFLVITFAVKGREPASRALPEELLRDAPGPTA